MKRYFQFLLLIVPIVFSTSVAHAQIKMVITTNDGETYEFPVNDVAKMSWIVDDESNDGGTSDGENLPQVNNHEYVDLGLPSGTLWATCNVGANSPEECGDYFAWGETEPKSSYNTSNYKWYDSSTSSYTKYVHNTGWGSSTSEISLEIEDDAARANWGGDWRMPTLDEIRELNNSSYCTWTATTLNGVNGYQVTSKKNGKYIFLPAAGYRNGSSLYDAGSYGSYWLSSLDSSNSNGAYCLSFNSSGRHVLSYYRHGGHPVRPVLGSVQN